MTKNIIIIIALAGVSWLSYKEGLKVGRRHEFHRAEAYWTEYYYRQARIDRRTCEIIKEAERSHGK